MVRYARAYLYGRCAYSQNATKLSCFQRCCCL